MATDPAVADTSPVHRIEFDVEWPPGHAAAYLLDDPEPTLVDAGMPGADNERALRDGLAAVGLDPADVEHLVVTHPHVDHVGLAPELLEAGDPAVYAPAPYRESLDRSLDAVADGVARTAREAGVPAELVDHVVERATERTGEIRGLLPGEAVDVWVEPGDAVAVGGRTFEAVHTPGHQRDHLCLATDLDGERALFSGDMVIEPFRAAAVHANFDVDQREGVTAYYASLDRLAGLSVDRAYPGHGPAHADVEGALETAHESLDRLLDRTEAALRPSGSHAVHVASERTDDIADGPWLPEAIAALAHLERVGRAESSLADGVRYYVPA